MDLNLSSNGTENSARAPEKALNGIVGSLSVLLFLVVVAVFFRRRGKSWISALFALSLSLSSLGRGVYYVLVLLQFYEICFPTWMIHFVYTLPSVFLFVTYTITLSFWGEAYARSFEKRSEEDPLLAESNYGIPRTPELRRVVVILTVVAISIFVGLYILNIYLEGWVECQPNAKIFTDTTQATIWLVIAVLYLGTFPQTVGFVFYNYKLYKKNFLAKETRVEAKQKQMLKLFAFVAIFCLGCFLAQAIAIFLWEKGIVFDTWWEDPVYFFCLESIPLAVMLYLLHSFS